MFSLRNPFIMAPIKLGYGDKSGKINDKFISFYEKRSNRIGAIIPEPFYLDRGLRELPAQMGIDDDQKIEGLQKLTSTIQGKGAKVIAHLNHPGRMANPNIPGNYFVSSTDNPCPNGGAIPKRMTEKDMQDVVDLFVSAAKRAEQSGFDALELQMGHGYLLAQFLSPSVNDRSDRYGGSFENRIRLPIRVLKEVKSAVSIPLIVRVSGDEMISNGITLDETKVFTTLLEEQGASAIHVSAGTVCSSPPWFFQHMFVQKGKTWELAGEIQKDLEIPVIFVGRVNTVDDINRLFNEYDALFVAVGRALVADPDFLVKYFEEDSQPVRPCLACSDGCLGGVKSGQGLQCVVNPELSFGEKPIKLSKHPQSFAVVGGGLAGMQAALTLHLRGHKVKMYEKETLGGQFNLAYLPPNKGSLKGIIDYYQTLLKLYNIPVISKEATANDILSHSYDGVILATGSRPMIPPINGLKKYYWAECLIEENLPENKKVVVIGGGLIGVEIASNLLEKKNQVFIVEMMDEIARGMELIEKKLTLQKLSRHGVTILTDTKVTQIEDKSVFLEGANKMVVDDVDVIVVATGMKSYNPLESQLRNDLSVYVVGDALNVGKAKDAIQSGYEVALNL